MNLTQVKRIHQKLDQLRQLDPEGILLFGAEFHGYQLNPCASEGQLQQFESAHQISLPEGYREFLLHCGNGGAGPYYGLYELDVLQSQKAVVTTSRKKIEVASFSSSPEYLARYYDDSKKGYDEADAAFYAGMQQKALKISTPGCHYETFLVVDGPKRGQVWTWDSNLVQKFRYGFWPEILASVEDQIEEAKTVIPVEVFMSEETDWEEQLAYEITPFADPETHPSFTNLIELPEDGPLFLDWYEYWLDCGLLYFA